MRRNSGKAVWAAAYRAGGVQLRITTGAVVRTVRAVPGRQRGEFEESEGVYQSWEDADFLILKSELEPPAKGSKVEQLDPAGEVVATFNAVHKTGEKWWRWSDPYRTVYRLHTTQA